MGLPVVMSKFTYDSFGDNIPGCVGPDDGTLAKCIIDLHGNQTQWTALQKDGVSYIRQTHNRQRNKQRWSSIIKRNLSTATIKKKDRSIVLDVNPKAECEEGEEMYFNTYQDVDDAISWDTSYSSAFDHWSKFGKAEGRQYACKPPPSKENDGHDVDHNLLNFDLPRPKGKCEEGEEIYLTMYEDVAAAYHVDKIISSAFEQWTKWGEEGGWVYICK